MKTRSLIALLLAALLLLSGCAQGSLTPSATEPEDGTNTLAVETEEPGETAEKRSVWSNGLLRAVEIT